MMRLLFLLFTSIYVMACSVSADDVRDSQLAGFSSWQKDLVASNEYYDVYNSPVERLRENYSYCYFISARLMKDAEGKLKPLNRQFIEGSFDTYYYLNIDNSTCTQVSSLENFFYLEHLGSENNEINLEAMGLARAIATRSLDAEDADIQFLNAAARKCFTAESKISVNSVVETEKGYKLSAQCTRAKTEWNLFVESKTEQAGQIIGILAVEKEKMDSRK